MKEPMTIAEKSLALHEEWKGKIEMKSRVPVKTKEDLALAYTPGVAQPCLEIQKDVSKSFVYTNRWNSGSGAWRYRTGSRHAGNGRQMCSF